MANQNFGAFAGSVDDYSSLFDGYSTDTSMASQQTMTALPAPKEAEWNPTIGFHMKVDFATFYQHPTQGYYYVPVPAPADAPASTLSAPATVIPDAHMYEQIDENFGIDPYAFQDPTPFDPMTFEDPMVSGYAEAYPDTAYQFSPSRLLSSRNTPEYGTESVNTSTPRTQLAKKQGNRSLQEIQKRQLKYPPKQQRGGVYRPRKQSVIRTCTCAHNRTDSLEKVKRPENSFIIFRKTPMAEHVPVVQKLYDQVRVELGHQQTNREQSRSVAAGKVWSTMKEDVDQNGSRSMFKATYDSFLKKAIVAKRKHEAEYPGYVYMPNAAAELDFGNKDCTCGAREYNLKMKEEREMMKGLGSAQLINWSARLPKSARPSLKSKSKSKKKDDDSDDDLSDVPSDFGDDESDADEEVLRTPRRSRAMKRYESMEISSPTPSRRSARSTRGVKTPSVQTTSKTIIPTKWKGYALEVVEDVDMDTENSLFIPQASSPSRTGIRSPKHGRSPPSRLNSFDRFMPDMEEGLDENGLPISPPLRSSAGRRASPRASPRRFGSGLVLPGRR